MIAETFRFVSNFGLHLAAALLMALAWASIVRHTRDFAPWKRDTLLGLLFAAGAALGVAASLYSDLRVDLRGALIALAGLFGGPIPALLTALAASITQVIVQPANIAVATAFAIAAALAGIVARRILPQRGGQFRWWVFAALGVVLAVEMVLAMAAFMPGRNALSLLSIMLGALIIYPLTTTFIGTLMARELRRISTDDMLLRQHDLLRTTLDSLTIPVSITRYEDSTFLYANPAMAEFLGLSRPELAATPALNFYRSPEIRDLIIGQLSNKRAIHNQDLPLQRADGTAIDTLLSMQPITYDGQQAIVSGLIDITERKQNEQAAIDMAVQREWMRNMAGFIRHMSHDVKTPISTINTSLYLLRRADDAERRERHIENIAAQVERITHILDQLFEIARLDSADDARDHQPLVLDSLLQTVAGNVRLEAERKGITLKTDLSGGGHNVLGDSRHLVQAFTHLLQNAVSYTDDGGEIGLHSRLDADGDHFVVTVRDTGVGIAPEHLPHIFERFYRTDDARGQDTGGAGLGLAIVKKIITIHNGDISVASEPGTGSTFTVHLPIMADPGPIDDALGRDLEPVLPYAMRVMGQ